MLRLLPAVLCLSASLLAIAGCSGRTVSVGAVDGNVQTNPDAGSTGEGGNGKTCALGDKRGTVYHVGESFPRGDNCDSCTCEASGIVCGTSVCVDDPVCSVGGYYYLLGESFIGPDACNSCTCAVGGQISCTSTPCAPVCPPDGTIDCQPVVPAADKDKCRGFYHDWIVANCPGVSLSF